MLYKNIKDKYQCERDFYLVNEIETNLLKVGEEEVLNLYFYFDMKCNRLLLMTQIISII